MSIVREANCHRDMSAHMPGWMYPLSTRLPLNAVCAVPSITALESRAEVLEGARIRTPGLISGDTHLRAVFCGKARGSTPYPTCTDLPHSLGPNYHEPEA